MPPRPSRQPAQAVHDELKDRAAHATGDGKAVLEATALMAKDTMLIKGAAKLDGPRHLRAARHLGIRLLRL